MISDRHRFIFVHINKTGGTSIEKLFVPDADRADVQFKHAPAAFYRQAFPDRFRDYFKFGFVRNPWDWLVSRYHWSRDHQRLFDFGFGEMLSRLEAGVRLSAAAPWLEEALQPQIDRLTVDGAVGVDFVGRFETLQADFDGICARLRLDVGPLPHVFRTDRRRYVEYYDDESRRRVERLYAADIAAFGYRFDDRPASTPTAPASDPMNVVRTFWHGSDLTVYEKLALSSFVKCGHPVQLFSYHDLSPIDGVERVDARSILPEAELFCYRSGPGKGSYAAFANLFRYKMLHELGGIWADADVLCLKSLSTLPTACVGREDDTLINNAVMRFPPGHAVTGALYERARALGRNVGWGQAGPQLVTDVVRRNRDQVAVLPRAAFYPVHWAEAWKLIAAGEGEWCEKAAGGAWCVHWWNEMLRRMELRKDRIPPAGSFLHRYACEILGERAFDVWPAAVVDGWIEKLLATRRPSRWSAGAGTQRILHTGAFEFVPLGAADAGARPSGRPREHGAVAARPGAIRVERLAGNPIIRPSMLPGDDGANINGPSLIRVPAWIENPLGRYYLYFAHHEGKYIRLAYADELAGPWTVHRPGTLPLESTPCAAILNPVAARNRHVASPDVHVDDGAREIRMYFHGPVLASGPPQDERSYRQLSLVATSADGLAFAARDERLGNAYFRAFRWEGAWYALGMPGVVYRSADGLRDFVEGPTLFTADMRHSAVNVVGSTLQVFYTVVGENPERILLSMIDLTRPWTQWRAGAPSVVLEPRLDWEGAGLPARPSVRGIARAPVRQLRDPAIFVDAGRTYLLYSVAGESGIAIAELHSA